MTKKKYIPYKLISNIKFSLIYNIVYLHFNFNFYKLK